MLESLKIKNKYGFSLFEVVVTMSIVAIFIAACSNVFTQRHKKRVTIPVHGRFECYRDADGNVRERMFNENILASERMLGRDDRCTFRPPKQALYLIINAVAGGGYGGQKYGGSAGLYTSIFLSGTSHVIEIIPGLAAESAEEKRGGNTIIYDKGADGTSEDKVLVDLKGGKSDSTSNLSFKNCTIAMTAFPCGASPRCTIKEPENNKEGYLEVSFCAYKSQQGTDSLYDPGDRALRTVNIPFITSLPNGDKNYDDLCAITPRFYNQNINIKSLLEIMGGSNANLEQLSNSVITYDYTKMQCTDPSTDADAATISYFKVNVSIEGNYTEYPEESDFNGYINSLNITDGIAETTGSGPNKRGISTGDGGGKNASGGHGAVLVTW